MIRIKIEVYEVGVKDIHGNDNLIDIFDVTDDTGDSWPDVIVGYLADDDDAAA